MLINNLNISNDSKSDVENYFGTITSKDGDYYKVMINNIEHNNIMSLSKVDYEVDEKVLLIYVSDVYFIIGSYDTKHDNECVTGYKEIINNSNNYYGIHYIIINDYKIVTIDYVRKVDGYFEVGNTVISDWFDGTLSEGFRPNIPQKYSYSDKLNLVINTNGELVVNNKSTKSVTETPYASFTYIVQNNII